MRSLGTKTQRHSLLAQTKVALDVGRDPDAGEISDAIMPNAHCCDQMLIA